MIKVNDKLTQNTYIFPKTYETYDNVYSITFEHKENGIKKCMLVEDVSNIPFYYAFYLDFSDYQDGEYKYTICGRLDDKGLIRIGSVKPKYKKNISKNKVKQYDE